MKWSIRLGRILGIDVYLHLTFLLLLGFVGLSYWLTNRTMTAAISGVLFFASLFACVLLHEFGHALAARRYGIHTTDITLLPVGGLARLERMPDKPLQEFWVALAGPLVNVVIAAGLFLGMNIRGLTESFNAVSAMTGSFAERLFAVNVFLVLFNLLPAFPMDGGRVLRAVLAMRMDYARATRLAANIGQGMAVVFGFVGVFVNPFLLFIALFVWIGAEQEAAATEMKSSLDEAFVRDAMLTLYRTLKPEQTLGEAARCLLAGSQQDFPVVDQGHVVGMLFRSDLIRALQKRGEGASIGSVMCRDFDTADADALLARALAQIHSGRGLSMPVVRDGQLVGVLTAENVGEYYMVRSALAHERRGTSTPARNVPPVIVGALSDYGQASPRPR